MIFPFPGVIVFGSDQEVGELMKAVERANRSGHFSWIGSDGWGGRTLVSDGNEQQVRHNRLGVTHAYSYNYDQH
jgi:hypothetical protein